MLASIETALARPWYRLRLGADLEARFAAQGLIGNVRRIRSWLLVFAIFNVVSLRLDFEQFGADAVLVPAALTLGMIIPVTLIAFAMLGDRSSPRRQTLAVLATSTVTMAVTLNSARTVPGPHVDTYLILAAIVPLVVGLIAPMSFRHSLVYCGACFALYLGTVLAIVADRAEGYGVPLLVACLILVPLKLSYGREWETRQMFLLGLRDHLHRDALARDNDRLTTLSETDALTGIANRRAFDAGLAGGWARAVAGRTWFGVALVDVDRFKLFNDAAGHAAGDRCLRRVATALQRTAIGFGGTFARYGGEEFAVLLPDLDPERTLLALDTLIETVRRLQLPHPGLGTEQFVSVSIGATCAHGTTQALGTTGEALVRAADHALYDAKAGGRDRACVRAVALAPERMAVALVA